VVVAAAAVAAAEHPLATPVLMARVAQEAALAVTAAKAMDRQAALAVTAELAGRRQALLGPREMLGPNLAAASVLVEAAGEARVLNQTLLEAREVVAERMGLAAVVVAAAGDLAARMEWAVTAPTESLLLLTNQQDRRRQAKHQSVAA
jgi:hypothetical protein